MPHLSCQLSGFSQLGTPAAIDNPSGCSSSARRCRMKAARCRRPDLSWACGMPLLNWLATELDSVLLMVEHRANHMALRVRFPRKTRQCLHCHLLGRKPPAPAHRSDGAGPTKPCGARHRAKRRRLAHRVCGKELRAVIDGEGSDGVAHATPGGTHRTARPLYVSPGPPLCPPPAL